MLTLELSSYVLENPNDAYTTLSQLWLAAQHSVKSTAGCSLYWNVMRLQLWTVTSPINTIDYRVYNNRFIIGVVIATNIHVYIAHIYSGEGDKCSALVARNNKIKQFIIID